MDGWRDERQMDGGIDGQIDGWRESQTNDGLRDGCLDGWLHGIAVPRAC